MLCVTQATNMTFQEVCDTIPLAQCWAIKAWRELENPYVTMELVDGYVAQEIRRLRGR